MKRQESDLLEEEEEDSDGSEMSSFAGSIDSASMLDSVDGPTNGSPAGHIIRYLAKGIDSVSDQEVEARTASLTSFAATATPLAWYSRRVFSLLLLMRSVPKLQCHSNRLHHCRGKETLIHYDYGYGLHLRPLQPHRLRFSSDEVFTRMRQTIDRLLLLI